MQQLIEIARRVGLPDAEAYTALINKTIDTLYTEDPLYRPYDEQNRPGGMIRLNDRPTLIIPDLHARPWFLLHVLAYQPVLKSVENAESAESLERVASAESIESESTESGENSPDGYDDGEEYAADADTDALDALREGQRFTSADAVPAEDGVTVGELLQRGEIQIVCVGDGFHAESRAAQRWKQAFKEFSGKYRRHNAMDEEMRESFGLMEIVMQLKTMFPESFHFLKGNHENILNEEGRGNHPFRKFAFEGEMVKEWVLKFYGEEFISSFAEMEHEFPLLAVDGTFMISHAEPQRYFTHEEVIRYRQYEDVVLGLTWTPNDGAEQGSVQRMIAEYCSHPDQARYFGGHRPVKGTYNLRADDKYIQLHNPGTYSFALVYPGRTPDPQQDIIEIPYDEEAVLHAAERWG